VILGKFHRDADVEVHGPMTRLGDAHLTGPAFQRWNKNVPHAEAQALNLLIKSGGFS